MTCATAAADLPGWRVVAPGSISWSATARAMLKRRQSDNRLTGATVEDDRASGDPEETLELDGLSDSAWRERIGNAVPPPAAAAIASVMGRALLATWSGQTFMLSSEPIWVRPIATALALATD